MNSPTPKARTIASAMSSRLTALTFSRKLDLKMSLKLMSVYSFVSYYP